MCIIYLVAYLWILTDTLYFFTSLWDFHNFRLRNVSASGKSALEMYMEEPVGDMMTFPNLDVLAYWKNNSHRFGRLATMASDLLSILITTVASEFSFSIGSRVLDKYQSCLLPRNVQALICARNWLRGFEPYDNGKFMLFPSQFSTYSYSYIVVTYLHLCFAGLHSNRGCLS